MREFLAVLLLLACIFAVIPEASSEDNGDSLEKAVVEALLSSPIEGCEEKTIGDLLDGFTYKVEFHTFKAPNKDNSGYYILIDVTAFGGMRKITSRLVLLEKGGFQILYVKSNGIPLEESTVKKAIGIACSIMKSGQTVSYSW